MTHGHPVLPDFGPGKIAESAKLAEELHDLADADLLRVVSASIHELIHRHPHLTADRVAGATRLSIAEVHAMGFE